MNHSKQPLSLGNEDVHLWFAKPDELLDNPLLSYYPALLTDEELLRQQSFMFDKDRHAALVTRAFVRTLLSTYTGGSDYIAPQDWRFIKGKKGKPEILDPPMPLRFNLSHCKGMIVCAVALTVDIGVDVEYIPRKSAFLQVAAHKFSACEFAELKAQPVADQRARFFDYWTLKESYIKAVGGGLSIPLQQFSFMIEDDQHISIAFEPQLSDDPTQWQHRLLYGSDQHRMALSIKDPSQRPYRIKCFQSIPLVAYWPVELPLTSKG